MTYCIDANIFLRVLVKDEPKQFQDCVRLLEKIKKGSMIAFTPSVVIAEVGWTLRSVYKSTKSEIVMAIRSILSLQHLKIKGEPNVSLAIDLYKQYNVKLIDAFIASIKIVYTREAKIISYDQDFDRLGVVRIEPADL